MHGYFMDVRLYNKAKSVIEPFRFDKFRKEKIRQEIELQRPNRIQLKTDLPKINQDLALKILNDEQIDDKSKLNKKAPNLLEDERFKVMFENPDYQIDKNAEEYKMLAPVLNRLEKSKTKEIKKRIEISRVEELHAEEEKQKQYESSDDDEDLFKNDDNDDENSEDDDEAESSEDDAKEFSKEMKKAYKEIKRDRERKEEEEEEEDNEDDDQNVDNKNRSDGSKTTKMIELDNMTEFKLNKLKMKANKKSLQDRLHKELSSASITTVGGSLSNRKIQFEIKPKSKYMKKREYEMKKHHQERRELLRSTASLKLKKLKIK